MSPRSVWSRGLSNVPPISPSAAPCLWWLPQWRIWGGPSWCHRTSLWCSLWLLQSGWLRRALSSTRWRSVWKSWDFEVFLPKVANAVRCMVSRRISHFSVAESLGCEAASSLKIHCKLVWQTHPAGVNAGIPLFLVAVELLWLHPDLAADQGVVCVAVRTVVSASVEDVLNGGASDQDEV